MSNRDDLSKLDFTDIYKGEPNTVRAGTICYNEKAIRKARKQSARDKAILKRQAAFKKIVMNFALIGFLSLAVYGAVSIVQARGEIDSTNIAIQDEYVDELGSIMENYTEDDMFVVANKAIEEATRMKGPKAEADIQIIQNCLQRIEELKNKGMDEEVGLKWKAILQIASEYDSFLPGFNY